MASEPFTIGALARSAGVTPDTVRFYERRGLLPAPARSEGGQRRYDPGALARLRFIRQSRELGFGLASVAELLHLAESGRDCGRVQALARTQRERVNERLAELERLGRALDHAIARCAAAEAGGEACPLLFCMLDDSRA